MQLTIHTTTTAPAASRPILEGIAADIGFVPNLAASLAESPTALGAFDGLRRTVGSGGLDPELREVAGLAVGVAVDNAYGVAFHSTVLRSLGAEDADLEAMRAGAPPAAPAPAAVYALASALVLSGGKVGDDVVQRALDAGLSTAAVLEVVIECTFAGLVGLVDNLAGRVELDGFLEPQAWKG